MSARTTSELVGGIIEVDSNISLDPFITTANELVTEICVPAGYTDERLELIERFLAAHFYTLRDPRPTSEGAGSVQAAYQSKVDLGLKTSHYGQQAMILDTAGGLAELNANTHIMPTVARTVSVTWLGTEDESSTT